MSPTLTILCIDDNVLLLALRKALLESSDFKVFTAENGPAGLEIANREHIDVAILDYNLPGMDGGRVAKELRTSCPSVAILLSSGMQEIPESVLALMDGVVPKGASSVVLIQTIDRVTRAKSAPPVQIPEIARTEQVEHSRGFVHPQQLRGRLRGKRSR